MAKEMSGVLFSLSLSFPLQSEGVPGDVIIAKEMSGVLFSLSLSFLQSEGVPGDVNAGPYQTRVIVRDVSGKYTWDSTLLYGPQNTQEGEKEGEAEGQCIRSLNLLFWI